MPILAHVHMHACYHVWWSGVNSWQPAEGRNDDSLPLLWLCCTVVGGAAFVCGWEAFAAFLRHRTLPANAHARPYCCFSFPSFSPL